MIVTISLPLLPSSAMPDLVIAEVSIYFRESSDLWYLKALELTSAENVTSVKHLKWGNCNVDTQNQ